MKQFIVVPCWLQDSWHDVLLNVNSIRYARAMRTNTEIRFGGGDFLTVKIPFDEFCRLVSD